MLLENNLSETASPKRKRRYRSALAGDACMENRSLRPRVTLGNILCLGKFYRIRNAGDLIFHTQAACLLQTRKVNCSPADFPAYEIWKPVPVTDAMEEARWESQSPEAIHSCGIFLRPENRNTGPGTQPDMEKLEHSWTTVVHMAKGEMYDVSCLLLFQI